MNSDNNSKKNKVLKAGAGYVVGNYLLKGITFLSAPIFTRLLSTAEYGDYNLYLTYESIIYIIVGLAIHSSINNAKYKYKERLDQYVSSIVLLTMVSAAVWFFFANLFLDVYSMKIGFDRLVVNILIFHCLCSSLLQIYNSYVSLTYSVGAFLKLTSFNGIANIVVSAALILSLFSSQRYLGRIIGTVIPIGIIGIYIIIFFFRKSFPKINTEYWKFGIIYSLPIIPHGISQVILSSFDRIMIKSMVGSNEAGLYSFSYTICVLLNVATNSLGNVWKPWIYEKMTSEDYNSIKRRGTEYAVVMAAITSMILLVSPELIKIMGDREYWGLSPCVVPVVIGGFFSFLYSLPVMVEYFYEKTKFIAVGTVSAATINIVLNYIFIAKYGYIAAAYTTVITYFLYFLFHYVVATKIHGSLLFDTFSLFAISIGVIVIGAVSLLCEHIIIIRWLITFIIGIVFVVFSEKEFKLVTNVKRKLFH